MSAMEDDDSSNGKQFLIFHPPSSMMEKKDEEDQNQRRHRSRSRSSSRKRVNKSTSHSPVLSKESRRCIKRQIIVLKLCSMEAVQPQLTWNDLPEVKPLEPGSVDLVTITNPGNPSSFYVVFENQLDYGFNNPEWSKHFPAFETGSEALQGISCALTLHHVTAAQVNANAKTEDIPKERSFIPMELVAIKQMFKFKTPEMSYQIRRGVIMGEVLGEPGTHRNRMFKVYLIDFGMMLMVSENLILPLPYPFQFIAPLAIHVGLYGISPFGPQWCPASISMFATNIAKFSREGEPSFHVEICSKTQGPLSPRKVVEVLLRPLKTEPSKTDNFTEFLAQKNLGIPWNPFPSRPGLMSGINATKNKPFSSSSSFQAQEKVENEERRVKLRDAVLITATNAKLFHFLCWFELASDIFRLFHLRKGHFIPVCGMRNRVVLYQKNGDRDNRKPNGKSDQRRKY